MNWKIKMALIACSLVVSCPMEGAGSRVERSLRSPHMVNETSTVLQEMHGQMKLMQEQLSGLKASQQLLSAESAIKSLTPKVRKMEVHLDRIEKQLERVASLPEVESIKTDMKDLKEKFKAFITKPDSTLDEAINAISPTLDRVQKQVFFLYEAYKKQGAEQKQYIQSQFDAISVKLSDFEADIDRKGADLSSAQSSLSLLRQSVQTQHDFLSRVKSDLEMLKNEKIGLLEKDIEVIKQSKQDEKITGDVSVLQRQIRKLAVVFKKTLASVHETSAKAEGSFKLASGLDNRVTEVEKQNHIIRNGVKVVYKKTLQSLNELGTLQSKLSHMETTLDKASQNMFSSFSDERMNLFKKGLVLLKTRSDKLSKEVDNLNKELKVGLESVKSGLTPIHQKIDRLYAQTGALYKETKQRVSKQDVDKIHTQLNKLFAQTNALYQKSLELSKTQLVTELVQKEDLMPIHEMINQHKETLNTLNQEIKNVQEGINKIKSASFDSIRDRSLIEKMEKQAKHLAGLQVRTRELIEKQAGVNQEVNAKLDRLARQAQVLYRKTKALVDETKSIKQAKTQNSEPSEKLKKGFRTLYALSKKLAAEQQAQAHQVHNFVQKTEASLEKLKLQAKALYIRSQNYATRDEIEALKVSFQSIEGKLAQPSLVVSDPNIDELKGQLAQIQLKLEEKDQAIAQLKRKVAFLTKTLHEKLEKTQETHKDRDLDQFKMQIEEKVNQQLSSLQSDRMLFESLLQRIAALEGSLSLDEPMGSISSSETSE